VASKKVIRLGEELLMDRRPKGMSVYQAATYYVDALSTARLSFTPDDDRAWRESVQEMFDEKQSVIERTKATVVEQCRHQAAQISLVSVALQDAKTNNEWLWLPVRCYNRWSNWGERWCIAQIRTLSKPPVVVRACTDQFKLQEVKRLMDLLIISPFHDVPASGEIPLGSHRKGDIRWLCASYGWEITLDSVLQANRERQICAQPSIHLNNPVPPHRCMIPQHVEAIAEHLNGIRDLGLIVASFFLVALCPDLVRPFQTLDWNLLQQKHPTFTFASPKPP
jgi:hypothetical protein